MGAFLSGSAGDWPLLDGNDLSVMVGVAMMLGVVASGSGYVPATRASKRDPMVPLGTSKGKRSRRVSVPFPRA